MTDPKSGKIVGGAWYKVYNDNPFEDYEEERANWYPDDSTREFAAQAITIMDRPRVGNATMPQICE